MSTTNPTQRFLCTKETPWASHIPTPVTHMEVDEVDMVDYDAGFQVGRYRCKNCGVLFYSEVES